MPERTSPQDDTANRTETDSAEQPGSAEATKSADSQKWAPQRVPAAAPRSETAEDPVSDLPRPDSTGERPADPESGLGSRAYRQPGAQDRPGNQVRTSEPVATPRWRQAPYSSGALSAAGVTGLIAAATVPLDRPGIGWLLAGSAAAGAMSVVHRRARRTADPGQREPAVPFRNRERLFWAVAALALLAVGTFRAAGWLFVLCVGAAAVAGSLAVVDRRSAYGVLHDAIAVPLSTISALRWVYAARGGLPGGVGTRHRRLGVSTAVTVMLLAIFVPLLAGADATFAAFVEGLMPRTDGATVTGWIVVFLVAAVGSLSALYLSAGTPDPAEQRAGVANQTLRRLEWGLPVGALTVLFALFLGAQLVALFGGDDYVQRTAGLTYAEYARSGFWQLSAVTVLTLAVILPVLHRAARDSAADRLWLRALLCAISGLTLVIIASALGRMWTYQQAYGFTVLRLLVGTCELWLGIVYVLVIIAVLRLQSAWLPRLTVGTALAALLALAVLNPEALVASQNIDRWQHGKDLDVAYLAGLSVDIVPAIDRLPAAIRVDLTHRLGHRLDDDTWNSWNLARMKAR
ncbi:DUF4153 domain-containing protein [Nocardia sp. NBC_00416]|uniref:DUF4153 domain-containing protein n=1 Tax=Nocardia sp. NBC_00416 TaxID=2975991 RepID=UPI002E210F30